MTLAGLSSFGNAHPHLIRETWRPSSGSLQSSKRFLNETLQRAPSRRSRQGPCPRTHLNCPERNTDPAVSSCSTHTHVEGTWGSRTGGGGQPSEGAGDVGVPVTAPPHLWPPGPGLLPLLGTAPGLRGAAAPALVGDCGKTPLSWQFWGPRGAGAREGMEEDSLPSPFLLSPSFP